MSLMKDLMKATKNEFASIVSDGIECGDVAGWLDSGSYSLNALISGSIYGGFPLGKASILAGDPAAGKTLGVLTTVKLFLENNPNGFVMYFESESALSKDMFENFGIASNRVAVLPVVTVQEFRHQIITILDKYIASNKKEDRPPMLVVLDSLGLLSTTKEISDTTSGEETKDLTRNQIIKATFRVITLKLGRANVPLLMTQHTYATLDKYNPKEIAGGGSLKFAASTIIMLNKRKERGDDKEIVGNNVRAVAMKSRFTREFAQVEVLIDFTAGIKRFSGLLEIAEKSGVIVKEGTRYLLADGRKVFGKFINEHPEEVYTKEILDKIDAGCKAIFGYGGKHDPTIETIDETTGEISNG